MFRKLKQTAVTFLRQGLSPERVAAAIAVGVTLGIFPIYGTVFLSCLAFTWLFRLNAPITFAGSYSMFIIKPLLIIPFLRFGEFLFRADPLSISLIELSRRFSQDALGTLQTFGWSFIHASVGWLVVAPAVVGSVYVLSLPGIQRWQDWRAEGTVEQEA